MVYPGVEYAQQWLEDCARILCNPSDVMKSKPSCSLTLALLLLASVALPNGASGAFVFTISPVGPNVVVTGSGSFDLSALVIDVPPSESGFSGGMWPGAAILFSGPSVPVDEYRSTPGVINFGPGGVTQSTSDFGDAVGIHGGLSGGLLYVPAGYISGSQLVTGSTYANQTLASLGLTPGNYVFRWGSGGSADSLTVSIVPEPSICSLLACGVALAAILFIRARRRASA